MAADAIGPWRVVSEIRSYCVRGYLYLADHTELGRRVLLQVLFRKVANQPAELERRFREMRAVSAIGCPGILPVIETGRDPNGAAYVVMELAAGELLGKRLTRGPLAPPTALAIARRIASALGAAHARGFIHRSLTGDAVFVDDVDVQVFDFSHGEIDPAPDRDDVAVVMPPGVANLAPEQVLGQPIDHRADIYALGCLLFEMLCGEPAVQGGMFATVLDPTPDIRSRDPNVSASVAALLLQLMAKDPAERPPTMEAVIRALDRL